MELREVLSGQAGPDGIRRFLQSPPAREALRHELLDLSFAPESLGPCHLQQARFRLDPEAKLTAGFRVAVHGPEAASHSSWPLSVTWKPRWIGKVYPNGGASGIEDSQGVLRPPPATPFRRHAARVPAWGMRIQVWPLDPDFPQLPRMSDPNYAAWLIAMVCASSLHLVSGFEPENRCRVTVIRYTPGQRHVLRYDPLASAQPAGPRVDESPLPFQNSIFAKLYNGGQAGRMFEVANWAAETLRAGGKEIAGLQPLGYAANDGVVLFPLVLGQPLHFRLGRGGRPTARAIELSGRALRALHDARPPATLPLHSFEAELCEVEEKARYVAALMPSLTTTIQAHMDRARELHARLPQELPTPTHGDAKVEHFWATSEGIVVMDFDFCRCGDPALDLGQFLAELRLWDDFYGQNAIADTQNQFLKGYASCIPKGRLLRARLYESLELIKAVVRRVPLSHPQWEPRVVRWLERAVRLLEDLRAAT